MATKEKILIDIESNMSSYSKEIIQAKRNLEKLKEEQKKLLKEMSEVDKRSKEYKTLQKKFADVTGEIKLNSMELRENTRSLAEAKKVAEVADGSYAKIYLQWKLAEDELKKLTGTMKVHESGFVELTQEYLDARVKVDNLKVGLDKFGEGIHDNRLNVGNYKEAVRGAFNGVKRFGDVLPAAKNSVLVFNQAIKANPLGFFIGLISGLVSWFMQLKPVQEAITKATELMGRAFSGVMAIWKGIFTGNIIGGFKDFANAIKGIKTETAAEQMERLTKQIAVMEAERADIIRLNKQIMEDDERTYEKRTEAAGKYYDALIQLGNVRLAKLEKEINGNKDIEAGEKSKIQLYQEELKTIKQLQSAGIETAEYEFKLGQLRNEIGEERLQQYYELTTALGLLQEESFTAIEGIYKEEKDQLDELKKEYKSIDDLLLEDRKEFTDSLKAEIDKEIEAIASGIDSKKEWEEKYSAWLKERDLIDAENAKQVRADDLRDWIAHQDAKAAVAMAANDVLSGLSMAADAFGVKSIAFKKTLGLAQIGIDTAVGLMKASTIAAESAAGTGPAAAYAYPLFYLQTVASVLGAAAKAKQVLSQVRPGSAPTPSSGGGRGFSSASFGQISNPVKQSQQTTAQQVAAIQKMPTPVVTVEDINATQMKRVNVTSKANV